MRAVTIGWRRSQRGMSLVELMVGITVGLFVVAAASTLMASQMSDNRKLLIETQLQQDMRASMDIITRQLRRAGSVDIGKAQAGLATDGGIGGDKSAYTTVNLPSASQISFSFYRNAAESGPYGFKLDGNTVKSINIDGGWQDLTDPNTLKVTAFTITPNVSASVLPCPKLCPDGTAGCWPTLVVRGYTLSMVAEARNDSSVQRSISSEVRLRNDWVRFNNAAAPTLACPA